MLTGGRGGIDGGSVIMVAGRGRDQLGIRAGLGGNQSNAIDDSALGARRSALGARHSALGTSDTEPVACRRRPFRLGFSEAFFREAIPDSAPKSGLVFTGF